MLNNFKKLKLNAPGDLIQALYVDIVKIDRQEPIVLNYFV